MYRSNIRHFLLNFDVYMTHGVTDDDINIFNNFKISNCLKAQG